MLRIVTLAMVAFTATYAGVQLARNPPDVVQVTDTRHCRSIGMVSAVILIKIDTSKNELRRKVDAIGGNAYRVISETSDPLSESVRMRAEALDCR